MHPDWSCKSLWCSQNPPPLPPPPPPSETGWPRHTETSHDLQMAWRVHLPSHCPLAFPFPRLLVCPFFLICLPHLHPRLTSLLHRRTIYIFLFIAFNLLLLFLFAQLLWYFIIPLPVFPPSSWPLTDTASVSLLLLLFVVTDSHQKSGVTFCLYP